MRQKHIRSTKALLEMFYFLYQSEDLDFFAAVIIEAMDIQFQGDTGVYELFW